MPSLISTAHVDRRPARAASMVGVATMLALTACAGLPGKDTGTAPKPAQAYATARTFSAPDATWPTDAWWVAYGDPQLDSLMAEALSGAPDLVQAQARLRRAESLLNQARADTGPNLALNARTQELKQSYNYGIPAEFVPHGYNTAGQVSLDFSWELDFWGRNRAAVAAASSEAQAARADVAEARLMLSTSVADAYADLTRLYAMRDLAERTVTLRQSTEALVRDRVANGLDTQGELRQAQSAPANARADLAAIDEQIALSRDRLAALVGAGPDRGLSITRPAAASLKPFGLPANLAADLVGRRPDIVAARWRAEAASSRTRQARAAFYPNINLAAGIGFAALPITQLVSSGSDIGNVGPALSLPIFDAGRIKAGLRGAEAGRDEAVGAYDAAVVRALREVADAAASKRALQARLAQSRDALAASEQAYRIARLRYSGGLSTYQAVLLAEQDVLTQRRTVTDLESRALSLDVALVRALGGGFTSA